MLSGLLYKVQNNMPPDYQNSIFYTVLSYKFIYVDLFYHMLCLQVEEAYVACGQTLQNKLPINKSVAAVHPDARGHTLSLTYLQRLPTLASTVLTEDELDKYDLEVRRFQTDSLPEFKKGQW